MSRVMGEFCDECINRQEIKISHKLHYFGRVYDGEHLNIVHSDVLHIKDFKTVICDECGNEIVGSITTIKGVPGYVAHYGDSFKTIPHKTADHIKYLTTYCYTAPVIVPGFGTMIKLNSKIGQISYIYFNQECVSTQNYLQLSSFKLSTYKLSTGQVIKVCNDADRNIYVIDQNGDYVPYETLELVHIFDDYTERHVNDKVQIDVNEYSNTIVFTSLGGKYTKPAARTQIEEDDRPNPANL